MPEYPLNHHHENYSLNMLSGRMLFRVVTSEAATKSPSHTMQTEWEKILELERRGEPLAEMIEKEKENVGKYLKLYNSRYNKEWRALENEKNPGYEKYKHPYLRPISEDMDDHMKIIGDIDRILRSPFFEKGKWRTMFADDISPARKVQCKDLLALRAVLADSEHIEGARDVGVMPINKHFLSEWNETCKAIKYYNDEGKIENYYKKGGIDLNLAKSLVKINVYFKKQSEADEEKRVIGEIAGKMKQVINALADTDQAKTNNYRDLIFRFAHVQLQAALLEGVKIPGKGAAYTQKFEHYNDHKDNVARLTGQSLLKGYENRRKMADQRLGWEKNDSFTEIGDAFSNAAKRPIISAGKEAYNKVSTREGELLFTAIMARDTNNFTQSFMLGAGTKPHEALKRGTMFQPYFGHDNWENAKNFSYIYHEWLKHNGVDVNRLENLTRDVIAIEEQIRAAGIPSAEDILASSSVAAIIGNKNKLEKLNTDYASGKSREYWIERKAILIDVWNRLIRDAKQAEADGKKGDAQRKAAGYLEDWHIKLATAQINRWHHLHNEKANIDINFTRNGLAGNENTAILTELCMLKLQKATEIVDHSQSGLSMGEYLDPTVRRLLIANIYDTGVTRLVYSEKTGQWEYKETVDTENYWLLSQLSTSRYFNNEKLGGNMDSRTRKLLALGVRANKAFIELDVQKVSVKVMEDVLKLKNKGLAPDSEDYKNAVLQLLNRYPAAMAERALLSKPEQMAERMKEVKLEIEERRSFIERTRKALHNPYDKEGKFNPDTEAFFADIESGAYKNIILAGELSRVNTDLSKIEVNYNTADLREKSRNDYLEQMGINIKGTYNAYLKVLEQNPDMFVHVNDWKDYSTSKNEAKFNKLCDFLTVIVQGSVAGGKEKFLKLLHTIYNNNPSSGDAEKDKEQFLALHILDVIESEIRERDEYISNSKRMEKENLAKLRGMHTGDKITKYAREIWQMATGSGSSIAERAAGIFAIIAAYKAIRYGLKGNDKYAWMIKLGVGLVATDIIAKKITNRGIFDRAGLDSLQQSMEGSFEAVLIEHGKEDPEYSMESQEIEDREHAAALFEMNKIPFHQLMHWYMMSGANGEKREGQKDYFPKGINIGRIVRGTKWRERNKQGEGKRIVKAAMRNFFRYLAKQNGIPEEKVMKILQKQWIKKNQEQPAEGSTELNYAELLKKCSQNEITWQMVMQSEIDLTAVEATKRKNGWTETYDYLAEYAGKFVKWTRQDVYGKMRGHIKTFADENGLKIDMLEKFVGDLGEDFAQGIHFLGNRIEVWWGNHQWEIKRLGSDLWELTLTGAKLPFELAYKGIEFAVPFTLKTIKQFREILRLDTLVPLNHDLELADIVKDKNIFKSFDQFSEETNPEYEYFGLYQMAFAQAFEAGTDNPKTGKREGMWFKTPSLYDAAKKETRERDMLGWPDENVGYYISVTTQEDAGLGPHNRESVLDRYDMMGSEAWKQARDFYMSKDRNLTAEDIKKYMYPIHMYSKSSESDKNPAKVYVFWRMPLHDSQEYTLKEAGRWAEYSNPNMYKKRLPFIKDPRKGILENLEAALALNTGPARNVVGVLSVGAIQPLHIVLGAMSKAAGIGMVFNPVNWLKIKKAIKGGNPAWERVEWLDSVLRPIDEDGFQSIDEVSTAAEWGKPLAFSEFYKKEENRQMYKALLDFARDNNQKLYLGLMKGQKDYQGKWYTQGKGSFSYQKFKDYYEKIWLKNGKNNPINGMIAAIKKQAKKEGEPVK